MKTATLTIDVPDDFTKGNCHECPLSYITDDWDDMCVLMRGYSDCPLEIQEGYKGCRNCKYQEAPLTACDYLKHLNHVELICQMYERKENHQ